MNDGSVCSLMYMCCGCHGAGGQGNSRLCWGGLWKHEACLS